MTLQEILTGALQQLDRGTDAQTVELWRDKLTAFVNDAIVDLANEFALRRTDRASLKEGRIDLGELPRDCVKVLALYIRGKRWPFYYGGGSAEIFVPGAPDGEVEICYRYVPLRVSADTDVPDIPERAQGLLALYAVGRERAAGDSTSMSAAPACFELYNAGKRNLRRHVGEQDAYTIENRY